MEGTAGQCLSETSRKPKVGQDDEPELFSNETHCERSLVLICSPREVDPRLHRDVKTRRVEAPSAVRANKLEEECQLFLRLADRYFHRILLFAIDRRESEHVFERLREGAESGARKRVSVWGSIGRDEDDLRVWCCCGSHAEQTKRDTVGRSTSECAGDEVVEGEQEIRINRPVPWSSTKASSRTAGSCSVGGSRRRAEKRVTSSGKERVRPYSRQAASRFARAPSIEIFLLCVSLPLACHFGHSSAERVFSRREAKRISGSSLKELEIGSGLFLAVSPRLLPAGERHGADS